MRRGVIGNKISYGRQKSYSQTIAEYLSSYFGANRFQHLSRYQKRLVTRHYYVIQPEYVVKQSSPAWMRLNGIKSYFNFIFKGSNTIHYKHFGCICIKCMDHDYDNCLNGDSCGDLKEKQWNVSLQMNENGVPIIPKKSNDNNKEVEEQLGPIPDLLPFENERIGARNVGNIENISIIANDININGNVMNHNRNRLRKRGSDESKEEENIYAPAPKRRRVIDNDSNAIIPSNNHNTNSNISNNQTITRYRYQYPFYRS